MTYNENIPGLEKSRLLFLKNRAGGFFWFLLAFSKKTGFYYYHLFKDFTAIFLNS